MDYLYRIFGPPHEALHVLALWLIGRRALKVTTRHVDIPDDLTTGQYVFVAGLPALVFWGVALVGLLMLATAPDLLRAAVGMGLLLVGGLAGFGTLGDIALIVSRLGEPPRD